MALEKSVVHLGKTKVFREVTPDVTEVDPEAVGVGLVDDEGDLTGTMQRPLSIRDLNTADILDQLRIMNHHLAAITGETFTPEG